MTFRTSMSASSRFRPRLEALEDRCLLNSALDVPGNPREVTVMSRNVYVGADFAPVFDPTAPGGPIFQASLAWNDVKQTNFPLRAEALADEIAANNPDLIGLQEVSAWYSGPADGGPFAGLPAVTVEYDYLEILRAQLIERGLHYEVVAEVKVFDEELPIFPDLTKPLIPANMKDFRLIDRDVILARADLSASQMKLSNAQTGHYASHVVSTLAMPGFPPVAISFERGWASVDVKVRGQEFRFITTHLEPEETAPAIQVAQAAELLAGPANTPMSVILVGDFNSRADGSGTPTYADFVAAGFDDAWSVTHPDQPGYTHGHTELLNDRNDTTGFERRIDLVLYRGDLNAFTSDVVGEETADFDGYGIWASDHAGVVATIGIHVRSQPTLEALPSPSSPAVSADLVGGNLVITATEATFLEIFQVDADSFGVTEFFSGTSVNIDGITGDVIVRLSDQNDAVLLYLFDQTTPDGVTIDLGGGANYLELGTFGGTIAGDLAILGGSDEDRLFFADGFGAGFRVNGYTAIFTGDGNDALDIGSGQVRFLRPAVIHLGDGDDFFANYGTFHEPARIDLGDGNDLFLNSGSFSQQSHVLGGRGTDTFLGLSSNLRKHSFEGGDL